MQKTATRLISKYGDDVQNVTVTMTAGADEFAPPTRSETSTTIEAVVTGAAKWADQETILQTDLSVLVSGVHDLLDVGGVIKIDGVNYKVIQRRPILAAGLPSAVRYFVRRG